MKFSLKLREVTLLPGVTLLCEPLDNDSYQRWLATLLRYAQVDSKELIRSLMTDPDVVKLINQLLLERVREVRGLELEQVDGTCRPAVVTDLPKLGGLLAPLLVAMMSLADKSSLTPADLGNSSAPPQPGPTGATAPPA